MSYDRSTSRNRRSAREWAGKDTFQRPEKPMQTGTETAPSARSTSDGTPPCPGGNAGRAAGGDDPATTSRPRSSAQTATDELARIETSSDVTWLRTVMMSRDNPLTLRNAAQRRLRILVRKPAL